MVHVTRAIGFLLLVVLLQAQTPFVPGHSGPMVPSITGGGSGPVGPTSPFPLDSGVINVTLPQYGVVSDPTCAIDNLPALKKAVAAAIPAYPTTSNPYAATIIYFPSGTYCFSGQISRGSLTANAVSSITCTAGVATVTTPANTGVGANDQWITTITGASPSGFSGVFLATDNSHGATTFTYPISPCPAGSATGTITYTTPSWQGNFALYGQDKSTTILKLQNGSAPFQDASNPVGFLFNANDSAVAFDPTTGNGDSAFGNYIENFTIDVNTGNPGAMGIDFIASNTGGLRHLNIIGHGNHTAGLWMMRPYPGPFIEEDVSIDQWDNCQVVGWPFAVVTMESVTMTRCAVRGLQSTSQIIAANNLSISTNNASAIAIENANVNCFSIVTCTSPYSQNMGLMVLQNTTLNGSGGGAKPTQLGGAGGTDTASWNFWHVTASGFTAGNGTLDGSGHGLTTGVPGPTNWTITGLLPPAEPVGTWVNFQNYGANQYDFTIPLKAAFDDPANSVIYMPTNTYVIVDTSNLPIVIPNNISRIEGMLSSVQFVNSPTTSPYCLFTTDPTRTTPLFIKRLNGVNLATATDVCMIKFSSPSPAVGVFSDINGIPVLNRDSGAGVVFVENANSTHSTINGSADAYFRQIDPEVDGTCWTIAGTAHVWALGFKSEEGCTLMDISGGATVEVPGSAAFCGISNCLTATPARNAFAVDKGNGSGTSILRVAYAELVQNTTAWAYPNVIAWKNSVIPNAAFPYRGAFNGVQVANWATDNNVGGSGSFSNTGVPVISGPTNCYTVAAVDYCPTLQASSGAWTLGTQPPPIGNEGYSISYTYQWYRDNTGSPIGGQTNSSYTITATDYGGGGHTLIVGVKAHSGAIVSSEAFSTATATVTDVALNPTTIPGIQVWYDASLGSTVTCSGSCVNGAQVTQITDRSGKSNTATQSTASLRPTLVVPAQNSLNGLLLASGTATQHLSLTTALNLDPGTVSITSGTYVSGTGVITLTAANTITLGNFVQLSGLTGTGGFAALNGTWQSIAGTNGSTIILQGPTGAGTSTITGGSAGPASYTVFAVARRGGAPTGAGDIELLGVASQVNDTITAAFGSEGNSNGNMYTSVTAGYQRCPAGLESGSHHRMSWYVSPDTTTADMTLDGASIVGCVGAATTLDVPNWDSLGNLRYPMNAIVDEVFVYSGHVTGTNASNLLGYLAAKWNVP